MGTGSFPIEIPILAYHDIDPGPRLGSLNPTIGQFEAQLRYLKEEGFRALSLTEAIAGKAVGRSVVLTFDDAYDGVYRYALPLLVRYGLVATVFVVTRFVGRRSLWDLNLRWLGARHMGWRGVRELDRSGMAIGSHTATHPNLVGVGPSRVRLELVESKRQLEDVLGREVDLLSYPFGRYNGEVKRAAISAGYRVACGIRPRRGDPPGDPLALKRIAIRSIDTLRDFRAKVKEGGPSRFQDWKEAFLAVLNRSSLLARRGYDRRDLEP